jgi:hypothetical protein
MGTFYTNEHYRSTKSYFESELLTGYPEGVVVKKHAIRGNKGFVLIERPDNILENGEPSREIIIFKIVKSDGVFGYKNFDESSNPGIYGCPKYMLKQSNCNIGLAPEWRKANIEFEQKEKKAQSNKSKMIPNVIYKVGSKKVEFKYHYSKTRFAGLAEGDDEIKAYRYKDIDWRDDE